MPVVTGRSCQLRYWMAACCRWPFKARDCRCRDDKAVLHWYLTNTCFAQMPNVSKPQRRRPTRSTHAYLACARLKNAEQYHRLEEPTPRPGYLTGSCASIKSAISRQADHRSTRAEKVPFSTFVQPPDRQRLAEIAKTARARRSSAPSPPSRARIRDAIHSSTSDSRKAIL